MFSMFSSLFGGGNFISGPEARDHVNKGAQLLDVRSPAEFKNGHIDGAKNIPVDQLPSRVKELKKGKTIVLYCQSGARAGRAQTMLKGAGWEEVHNLGGISNW